MGAFNIEHEQRRLKEKDIRSEDCVKSLEHQLRSLLAERTETTNPFTLEADKDEVRAVGFGHRGDLNLSYKKSVEEAPSEKIARRFHLENDGYNKAKEYFFKLPLYSTVLLFSPPPDTKIEGYPGYSLAYFYHILPSDDAKDKHKRTIKALSFINRFTKEEQASILNSLGCENVAKPKESSILLSPVGVYGLGKDTKSFETIWNTLEREYKKEKKDFFMPSFKTMEKFLLNGEELWNNKYETLATMISEIGKMISNGATEEELKDKWSIMLNLADQELLHKDITTEAHNKRDYSSFYDYSHSQQGLIFDQYKHLSFEPRVAATSCGSSGGMKSGLNNPLPDLGFKNNALIVTTSFEMTDAKDDPDLCRCGGKEPHFHCPGSKDGKACNHVIIVGKGISKCPSCGQGKTC